MRLVFVHGINNEDSTPLEIEETWWEAIREGWKAAGLTDKPKPAITTAYYAEILAKGLTSPAIEMGAGDASTGFGVGLLNEYLLAAGVTQEEIAASGAELGLLPEAVAQGVPHEGWLVNFASALERVLPTKGKLLAKLFLRQAVAYINDRALAAKIDRTVEKQVFDGRSDPIVWVAHSLGTVVSYRVLAGNAAAAGEVPLFLTLGSPLAVRMFKEILPQRGSIPNPPIAHWFNGRNPEDFVTLGRPITKSSIGFTDIFDSTEVLDTYDDKHSIVQYLASPEIARHIHALL